MTPEERARLIESVRLKFTSGNAVPVTRATLTRDEVDALIAEEREACAKVVDDWLLARGGLDRLASAIRARP